MSTRSLAALALVLVSALSACGSSDNPTATASRGTTAAPDVTCTYTATGTTTKKVDLPPTTPTAGGTVKATLVINDQDVPITLDASDAPCTVNSFLSLADQSFFDQTPCHRLVTSGIHVLQCGSPTGTGTGGPGYSFANEVKGDETYPAGTLAMAHSRLPDSNGSQFFLCYASCAYLNQKPDYTIFGKVSAAGLSVLAAIAAKGTADGSTDGAPKEPVTIDRVDFS